MTTKRLPLSVRVIGTGLVVLVMALCAMGILFAQLGRVVELNRQLEEAQQVVLATDDLLVAVIGMQTGVRGYALAGRTEFLDPYIEGKAQYGSYVAELRRLLKDDAEQTAFLESAHTRVGLWETQAAAPAIVLRDQGDAKGLEELVISGRGKALIDGVRDDLAAIQALQRVRVQRIQEEAERSQRNALVTAAAVMVGAAAAGTAIALYQARSVTRPVYALVDATQRIVQDGPGLQLPVATDDEVGRLTAAFNHMSAVQAEQQVRMAAQNEELTAQQEELTAQNEELEAQHAQLTSLVEQLELEHVRMQRMLDFAEAVASSADLQGLGERVLAGLMEGAQADVGAVILVRPDRSAEVLTGAGLTEAALRAGAAAASGLVGRTLEQRRTLAVSYPAGELLRPVYHTAVPVQEEIYLPMLFAGEALGVVVLGRTAPFPFETETRKILELMVAQAAAAISNGLAFERLSVAYGNLDAILGSTGEGIRLVDQQGRDVLVNDQYFRLMGVERGAALPTIGDEAPVRSEEGAGGVFWDTFEVKEPHPAVLQRYSAPAVDRRGHRVGRVFILRDVTREAEVDRMKTEFISTVSHELRTPLSAIRGYVDLMLEGDTGPITDEQREFLEIVQRSSVRLGNLISDLLDVEKIESGRIEMRHAPVQMVDLINRVGETFRVMAQESNLSLDLVVPAHLPVVLGDADRLEQVLANLVSNAIKYTKAGGVRIAAAHDATGRLAIAVSDTGVGIPPEALAQLFTKFFRVDNQYTREVGGTGLGLAIADAIVRQHGGEIRVESTPGQGSTFTVYLPVASAEVPPTPAPAVEPVGGRDPNRRLVLIVEDDPDLARLIDQYVSRQGYQTVIAASGADALREAQSQRPDLITLDVTLPDMDGWEVIAHLRSTPHTTAIPVLFISVEEEVAKGVRMGAAGYLTKPFDPANLIETIRTILCEAGRRVMLALASGEAEPLVGLLQREGYQAHLARTGDSLVPQLLEAGAGMLVIDRDWSPDGPLAELQAIHGHPGLEQLPVCLVDRREGQPPEMLLRWIQQTMRLTKGNCHGEGVGDRG